MLTICKCLRCGHDWASRRYARPPRCAGCGAKYWWRKARKKKGTALSAGLGRPRKYRVDVLKVGQKMTLPRDMGGLQSMRCAINAYAQKTKRAFKCVECVEGLRVFRIK